MNLSRFVNKVRATLGITNSFTGTPAAAVAFGLIEKTKGTLGAYVNSAGALVVPAGIAAAGGSSVSPRNFNTGNLPAISATPGVAQTPVITETYFAEIFVPATVSVTGIAVFNGTDVTGNIKMGVYGLTGLCLVKPQRPQVPERTPTSSYPSLPSSLSLARPPTSLPGRHRPPPRDRLPM